MSGWAFITADLLQQVNEVIQGGTTCVCCVVQ